MNAGKRGLLLATIPLATGINIAIGAIVYALKLPLYVDAVGTILTSVLLGWIPGAIVGTLGFAVTSLTINPLAIYFSGTQVAIALFVGLMNKKGFFKPGFRIVITGIGLGIVAAVVSAPVIVGLFEGVTGTGATFIVGYLASTGKTILQSVMLAGISIEPVDKTVQCLLALWIIRSLPKSVLSRFNAIEASDNSDVSRPTE